ncbi:hypothetical protein Trydic_g3868 [Trypoxylus dichotomus]
MNAQNDNGSIELDVEVMKRIENEFKEKEIKNYKIKVSTGAGKGDNYLGVIAKITAKGTDRNGQQISINWIAKIAPKGEGLRKVLDIDILYEREVYVYEKIFPLFEKFQDDRAVLKPFNFYASYVFSHLQEHCFVMEDMKSLGYIMKDRKKPLDYNHVKLVMEAYGKLHAISFALRDQDPELFGKLAESTVEAVFNKKDIDRERKKEHMAKYHNKVLESLHPEEDSVAIEKYKKYVENDVEIFADLFDNQNKYSVIGHGDSWVNNMLFRYENSDHPDRPTRICLLDWQLCRYGSPAFDLSYFVFTCTDEILRQRHYDNMIKLYYHSLCQHLADLGSDPEQLFPFEALESELKRASIFGLYMSIMIVRLMMSEVEEIPDLNDIDENKAVMDYKSVNDDVYKKRIRGMVLDFERYGYLDF